MLELPTGLFRPGNAIGFYLFATFKGVLRDIILSICVSGGLARSQYPNTLVVARKSIYV
jgi:hypothetical protein